LAQSFDTAQEIFNNFVLVNANLLFQNRTGIIHRQSFHLIIRAASCGLIFVRGLESLVTETFGKQKKD